MKALKLLKNPRERKRAIIRFHKIKKFFLLLKYNHFAREFILKRMEEKGIDFNIEKALSKEFFDGLIDLFKLECLGCVIREQIEEQGIEIISAEKIKDADDEGDEGDGEEWEVEERRYVYEVRQDYDGNQGDLIMEEEFDTQYGSVLTVSTKIQSFKN